MREKKSKQKIKTFDEYFQECLKNKTIPKDTPPYLKKALERAIKEYDNAIKLEKSTLSNFAQMYVVDGKPKITPFQFFTEKVTQIKEFLRKHRNAKKRMRMVCIMEQRHMERRKTVITRDEAYINTKTFINLKSTEVKVILLQMIKESLEGIAKYQRKGSAWYFKEVVSLEIHIVDYKRIKGSSYIPLPDYEKKSDNQYGKQRQQMFYLVCSSLSSSCSKKWIKNNRLEKT